MGLPHLEEGHPAILICSKHIDHRYDTKQCLVAECSGFVKHASNKRNN